MEQTESALENLQTPASSTAAENHKRAVLLEPEFAGQLAPQKNKGANLANRPTVLDRKHIKGTEVRAFLQNVQHGLVGKQRAVFVAIVFHFIHYDPGFRFTSAEILIEWHKKAPAAPTPDGKTAQPRLVPLEVHSLSPATLYGIPTREERQWKYGVAVPVSATAGFASVGIQPSIELHQAFPRDHRLTISGFAIGGGAKWSIRENSLQKTGIPTAFTCAMLVPYSMDDSSDSTTECQASVSVIIRTNWPGVSLKGMPWSKDDPVFFVAGEDLNPTLPTREFNNLSQADWATLVDNSLEFQHQMVSTNPAQAIV